MAKPKPKRPEPEPPPEPPPPPLNLVTTSGYDRDLKRAMKRGWPMDRLGEVVAALIAREALPERCRDHALSGEWQGWRDCHVRPDWILIYMVEGDDLVLGRTGTHSDLFG